MSCFLSHLYRLDWTMLRLRLMVDGPVKQPEDRGVWHWSIGAAMGLEVVQPFADSR